MGAFRFRKNKQVVPAIIGAALVLVPLGGAGGFYIHQLNTEHAAKIAQYENQVGELSASQTLIYGVARDVKPGEVLTQEDLKSVSVQTESLPSDAVLDESIVGRITKIGLKAGTPLTQEMLYEGDVTAQDLRNQEFRLIELPTKLGTSDYVDVRVKFPSGEDYIVLAKKQVEDLSNGTVWYTLNEKEILTMSSAIVDAYLNDASIYAISYVEPGLQQVAKVTYPSNENVLDLIETDPNIVQKATTELERRLRQKLEQNLSELSEADIQKYLSNKQNAETKINPDTQDNPLSQEGQAPMVDDGTGEVKNLDPTAPENNQ